MAQLHLVCGVAGAGKTTLAKKLAADIPAHRYCPDEWIAPLLLDHGDRAEMNRLRDIVEARQWLEARRQLALGGHVILENGFWVASERMALCQEAAGLSAEVVLHYLDVPLQLIQERLTARNHQLPEATFYIDPLEAAVWYESFERPQPDELALYHRVVKYRE